MSGIGLACTASASAIAALIAWGVAPGHRWAVAALAAAGCIAAAIFVHRLAARERDTEPEIRQPAIRERAHEEDQR